MINNRTVLTLTEAKEQQKFNFRETVSRPQLSATPCLRSPVSSLHLLLGGEDQGRSHDIWIQNEEGQGFFFGKIFLKRRPRFFLGRTKVAHALKLQVEFSGLPCSALASCTFNTLHNYFTQSKVDLIQNQASNVFYPQHLPPLRLLCHHWDGRACALECSGWSNSPLSSISNFHLSKRCTVCVYTVHTSGANTEIGFRLAPN